MNIVGAHNTALHCTVLKVVCAKWTRPMERKWCYCIGIEKNAARFQFSGAVT
jgi:hypothetical protein